MYQVLKGLRVVEGASFIAAPSCGLHLAQFGAEVIRFDPIGGGPDQHRWPLGPNGASLYWEGLNKGKKSIAIDLSRPEGRELAAHLAASGDGIFVTNYPADGFLSHHNLAKIRPDVIVARVMGWSDGAPALDYTINSAIGLPFMTGPLSLGDRPVNHVLPAWDLMTGAYAAFTVLAAERFRRETGSGQEIRLPLSDVAMASLGHIGQIGEVSVHGSDRPRMGNDLFGALGRDFVTADGHRIMLVALTPRQWSGLVKALALESAVAELETTLGVSFALDEGVRFEHRNALFEIIEPAVARHALDSLARTMDSHRVCWGPYQTLKEALGSEPRFSAANPVFAEVTHASGYRYLTPGAAATLSRCVREPVPTAPHLGEHTDQVLSEFLKLPDHEIGRLHDAGIVAGTG